MAPQSAIMRTGETGAQLFVALGSTPNNPAWSASSPLLFGDWSDAESFNAQTISRGATEQVRQLAAASRVVIIGYIIGIDVRASRWLKGGYSPAWTDVLSERMVFDTPEDALDFRARAGLVPEGHVLMIVRM